MAFARQARVGDPRMTAVVSGLERQGMIGAEAMGGGAMDAGDAGDPTLAAIRELRTIARTMMASTLIFLGFVIALSLTVGIAATSIATSLRDISATLSPETVQSAVGGIQNTINAGFQSASNVESFTADTADMGTLLVKALNGTVDLIKQGNAMAEKLVTNPSMHIQFASGP